MVNLRDFVKRDNTPSPKGSISQGVSTPNLEDLDRQIGEEVDRLVLELLPYYSRELCEAAARELGATSLVTLFDALEAEGESKIFRSRDLGMQIRKERVEERVAQLKQEITDLCDRRDRAFSKLAADTFQNQVTQKAQTLIPLRKLLREHKELNESLQTFSDNALLRLRTVLRRHLAGLYSWTSVYYSIRMELKKSVLTIIHLDNEKTELLSQFLCDE